jgi:hypothetical protein
MLDSDGAQKDQKTASFTVSGEPSTNQAEATISGLRKGEATFRNPNRALSNAPEFLFGT